MKSALIWSTIVVISCVLYFVYEQKTELAQEIVVFPEKIETFSIKKIFVIKAHEFDILLENDERYHVVLSIKTPERNSILEEVIDFFNESQSPRLILKIDQNNVYYDIIVSYNNEDVLYSDWLKENNFVWK